jgi:aerobic carbon-monoxide dehydrogenase small subunit
MMYDGKTMIKVKFTLNGKEISIKTESDRRVVDLLREDLGLTGTKEGCGTGECGACTILVDGESRLSCLMVAAQLEGKSITTIEGLRPEEKPGSADVLAPLPFHEGESLPALLEAHRVGRGLTRCVKTQAPLNGIQQAFITHGAVQCGFCTPGMVLAVEDLLKREPHPDRARIREGISGNLCRCTGYQKIVDAVEAVVRQRHTTHEDSNS